MSDYLALAQTHYENFPVGSFLLPRRHRVHMHRIYAFARTADDLADELQDAAALAAFRADFAAHLEGEPQPPMPLLRDLAATIRERSLPRQLFFDLLDAFAIDLEKSRHDRVSLMAYCRKSADPVGRLVLRVFGHDDEHMDALSDRVCTALQLVNHLQDIREDLLERDRIYFPVEDMQRFGVSRDDLTAPVASPPVRHLVGYWTDESVALLRQGWPITGLVGGRLGVELRAIIHGVALVVKRLRGADHDVLASHIRLSR